MERALGDLDGKHFSLSPMPLHKLMKKSLEAAHKGIWKNRMLVMPVSRTRDDVAPRSRLDDMMDS
jgi:hypothetical protein